MSLRILVVALAIVPEAAAVAQVCQTCVTPTVVVSTPQFVLQPAGQVFLTNRVLIPPQGQTTYSAQPQQIEALNLQLLMQQAIALQRLADESHAARQKRTLEFIERLAASAPKTVPPQAEVSTTPTLDRTCMKCHVGEAAKGKFRMDLAGFNVLGAMRAVSSGKMPPDGLTPAERVAAIHELLSVTEDTKP